LQKNLLIYRYNQLDKAILNAEKLGLNHGAALYPMVTVDGEECHNEWEITFEEIHRNISIVMAIKKYTDYTSDYSYMTNMGIEILVGISRFWAQRVSFSEKHNKYVILGVTGPNEYENNVNNNWYTNYGASWCLSYTLENLKRLKESNLSKYESFGFNENELDLWEKIVNKIYLPYSKKHKLYMQDDGFEDKELVHVDEIPKKRKTFKSKLVMG
jgi:maltose phosphorylase